MEKTEYVNTVIRDKTEVLRGPPGDSPLTDVPRSTYAVHLQTGPPDMGWRELRDTPDAVAMNCNANTLFREAGC